MENIKGSFDERNKKLFSLRENVVQLVSSEERETNERKQDEVIQEIENIRENHPLLVPFNEFPYYTHQNFNHLLQERLDISLWSSPPPDRKSKNSPFIRTDPQEFSSSFLHPDTPYNSLLLWHGTGVGKTCSAIGIAEEYKKILRKRGQKIWIICPKTLISTWYSEIFDVFKAFEQYKSTKKQKIQTHVPQCTQDTYTSAFNAIMKKYGDDDIASIQRRMHKVVGEFYRIMNYEKFIKVVSDIRNKTPSKEGDMIRNIRKEFNNALIIIDEAHSITIRNKHHTNLSTMANLSSIQSIKLSLGATVRLHSIPNSNGSNGSDGEVSSMSKDYRRSTKNINFMTGDKTNGVSRVERLSPGKIILYGKPNYQLPKYEMKPSEKHFQAKKNTSKSIMDVLQYVVRHSDNLKLLLLTATPLYNSREEIVDLMNLCRLNDSRPTFAVSDIFPNERINDKKLVSLTRGYISYVRGEDPRTFPLQMYPTIEGASGKDFKYEKLDDTIMVCVSKMSDAQYSLLKTRMKSTDIDSSKRMISSFVFSQNAKGPFAFDNSNFYLLFGNKLPFTQPTLKNRESMFQKKNMRRYCPKYATLLDHVENSHGIVFIYTEFMATGAYSIAMMLEENGFIRHSLQQPVLQNPSKYSRRGTSNSKRKYILFDSSLQSNVGALLDIVNSPRNKNGDEIKVIIGTKRVEQGISFKNVRQIHIMTPWFNMNRMKQIIGRGVRTYSHQMLPSEKRNVTLFFHISRYQKSAKGEIVSPDLDMYRKALQKQKLIHGVENILKKNSIDCLSYSKNNQVKIKNNAGQIMDSFNKRRPRKQGFPVSQSRNYTCGDDSKDGAKQRVISSSSRPKVVEKKIKVIAKEIRRLIFKQGQNSLTLDKIKSNLQSYFTEKSKNVQNLLQQILHYIITAKIEVTRGQQRGFVNFQGSRYLFSPLENKDPFTPMLYRKIHARVRKKSSNPIVNRSHVVEDKQKRSAVLSPFMENLMKTVVKHIPEFIQKKYAEKINGSNSYSPKRVKEFITQRQMMYFDSFPVTERLKILRWAADRWSAVEKHQKDSNETKQFFSVVEQFFGSSRKVSIVDGMQSLLALLRKDVPDRGITTSLTVYRCISEEGFSYFDAQTHNSLSRKESAFWESRFPISVKVKSKKTKFIQSKYKGFMELNRKGQPVLKIISKDSKTKRKNPKRGCACQRGQGLGKKEVIGELTRTLKRYFPSEIDHSVHRFHQNSAKILTKRTLCEEIELLLRSISHRDISFLSLRESLLISRKSN